jgi:hypothetical protein
LETVQRKISAVDASLLAQKERARLISASTKAVLKATELLDEKNPDQRQEHLRRMGEFETVARLLKPTDPADANGLKLYAGLNNILEPFSFS